MSRQYGHVIMTVHDITCTIEILILYVAVLICPDPSDKKPSRLVFRYMTIESKNPRVQSHLHKQVKATHFDRCYTDSSISERKETARTLKRLITR